MCRDVEFALNETEISVLMEAKLNLRETQS